MKLVIMVVAMIFAYEAHAVVEFKQPANDASACKTPVQKEQLRRYRNGKETMRPACLKLGGIKSTTPAINNCKTALQKSDLRRYLNGKEMSPPKCYKPAKWVGQTRSWASCSWQDKQKVLRIHNGKGDVMDRYPACYR
jgi:hypothetical protein